MSRDFRADIPEAFFRPWNKEADDYFPCQHCQCRHEVGIGWECPNAKEYGFNGSTRKGEEPSELIFLNNDLLNPVWLLTTGFNRPKGASYCKGEGMYKDGVLSYRPLPNLEFPLLSFELVEGPRLIKQYYLRVRSKDIFAATDFAKDIGELHLLQDIFFDFYTAVVRCAGLRYANLIFGWIIKDHADIVLPACGRIFRDGGLTYIDIRHAPISKDEIDEYLDGCHSGEDGDFYTTGTTSYWDGNWGFDYIEDGECVDYMPICDLIEGDEACGLLIDGYWLQDGTEYDLEAVLHMFTVVLDWIMDLWTPADALAVANGIVKEIPILNKLTSYLKDILAQDIESSKDDE